MAGASPGITQTAPPGTAGMSVQQIQAIQAAQMPGGGAAKPKKLPQFSVGQRIARTVMAAVMVAGAGAGARFGLNEYQARQAASEAVTEAETAVGFYGPIGSGLPIVDAVRADGRFVDMTVETSNEVEGTRTTTRFRHSLTTRNFTVDVDDVSGDGAISYIVDVRGEAISFQPDGAGGIWYSAHTDEELADQTDSFDSLVGLLPTFHDLAPIESLPFAQILSETDEQLPVVPLDVVIAPGPEVEAESGISASDDVDPLLADARDQVAQTNEQPGRAVIDVVRPPGPVNVRHYRLEFDEESFAAQAPLAYANWKSDPNGISSDFDVWVDALGMVRKIQWVDGDSTTSMLYYDVADELPAFQTTTLLTQPLPEF